MLLSIILLPLIFGTLGTSFLKFVFYKNHRILISSYACLITLACFVLLVINYQSTNYSGVVSEKYLWVADLGLDISLNLDGLSFFFGLLISGIGFLVSMYAASYLKKEDSFEKFYATLMLFMSAMLGVILANNLLLLIIFWELTSISSFLLVGFWGEKSEARKAARMALGVTGGGGLIMLGGFVILGNIAGTYEIDNLMGMRDIIQRDHNFPIALILILFGCFTKSAQFPFHFWLPQAMSAPTPVSAYLHSATMVKAGIFLLARLTPVIGGNDLFFNIVTSVGLITLLIGAFFAIFEYDVKGVLAYSTISHLGLIVFLIGIGTPLSITAAIFHILNHATFKAALFMIAGVIDHETGTRDLRKLGGLISYLPWTAAFSLVAAASMAGIPLFNGFISKEMFLTEAISIYDDNQLAWYVPVIAIMASMLGVIYSFNLVKRLFFGPQSQAMPYKNPHEPSWGMRAPIAVLCIVCIVVGILPSSSVGSLVAIAALAVNHHESNVHLSLWHGFNVPLAASIFAIVSGLIFIKFLKFGYHIKWFGVSVSARKIFYFIFNGIFAIAGIFSKSVDRKSLQSYLITMVISSITVSLFVFLSFDNFVMTGNRVLLPVSAFSMLMWLILLITCIFMLKNHHDRFQSVIFSGVAGLIVSVCFFGISAPDLALTQITIEIVSTVLLLMGLALLPAQTPHESSFSKKIRDGCIAAVAGAGVSWLAWIVLTSSHESIAWYFLKNSVQGAGGANIVNVILVDFRGYDTFGEITVLAISAIGVMALMDGMQTKKPSHDSHGNDWSFPKQPLMLQVAARLIFPLALVISIYIFFRGHNQPGGGFIAGLITSVALVLQYVALGQSKVESFLAAKDGRKFIFCLGIGLMIAILTGAGSFIFDQPFLTSAHGHIHIPLLGSIALASAAIFDLGVYVVVVSATLLTLSSLGRVSRGSSSVNSMDKL